MRARLVPVMFNDLNENLQSITFFNNIKDN